MGCLQNRLVLLAVFSIFIVVAAQPTLAAEPFSYFLDWFAGITGAQIGNETPTTSTAMTTSSSTTTTTYSTTSSTSTSSCPSSVLSALGEGCHLMYTDTDGKTIYCNSGMTRSMKEGESSRDGCTGPSSTGTSTTATTYSGTTTVTSSSGCTDSDGSIDITKYGTVKDSTGTYNDYCNDGRYIVEYFCDSSTGKAKVASADPKGYDCITSYGATGCSDGKCTFPATTTSTTYSTTCSKSNPWNCYDSTSCSNVGANWCKSSSASGGYCSSSTCPTCSTSSKYNCYTETDCKGASGSWCTSQYGGTPWCQDSSCPTYSCSKTESWYCKDETSCKGAGGNWCASSSASTAGGGSSYYCSTSSCPVCDKSNTWNCYSKETCSGAGANWCQTSGSSYGNCQSSSCPTCSKESPWNCYDETGCKGVTGNWCTSSGGGGWCSSSSCPTCSSSSKYNCYTETACTGATGKWCSYQTSGGSYAGGSTGYCSDSCPTYTCSKSEPWNCKDETTCKGASASWCTSAAPMPIPAGGAATATASTTSGWCSTSCPTCDKSNTWNCYTKDTCSGAGANWCTGSGSYGWCSTSSCPTCSSTSKYNCYSDTECKGAGGSWCASQYGGSGWCQDNSCPTYSCSSKETWNCRTESECKGAGASWCGTWCQTSSCPTCSKSQPWNCNTKETCTGTGANWCTSTPPVAYSTATASSPLYSSGWCQDSSCPTYTCSKTEPWYCYEQTTCVGAGAQWCAGYRGSSGYCSQTCPTYECTKESPWNCDTKEKCATISQSWCTASTGSWCASYCPTCSSTQKYNCYYKDECTSAGGNWCGTESAGWCSDQKCPSCSKTQPWNCYEKESCTTNGGNWCGQWCSAEPCPTCSKSQPWNCYVETDCKANGGNWCGTWCQEGSYPCPSTKGHLEEKKEIFIKPENCKEEKDPTTGYVHYVCEKNIEEKCPALPVGLKEKCEANGGKFSVKKDDRGCEFSDCRFKDEFDSDKKFIFKKFDRCPTDDELNEYQSSCEKSGGKLKTALEGGCKIGFCIQGGEHECEKEINPKLEKEIEEKCKKEGLIVIKDFDPRGCTVLHCGEPDYCKKIPTNAYDECENQGGELVVKTDDKGCTTFSECVKPGDEKVYLEEHEKITEVLEESELIEIALKLESLKVVFDKMEKQARDIADYYKSTGNLEEKRFIRVADMFSAAKDKIDEIKTKLGDKLSTLTTTDMEEIKLDVRKIRKVVMKDILYIMLSTKEDVKEIEEDKEVDCGTDSVCFERSFRICKRAAFTIEGGVVRVEGEKDGKCIIRSAVRTQFGAFEMKCDVPNYALGFKDPEKEIMPYCTGSMVDAIKTEKVG